MRSIDGHARGDGALFKAGLNMDRNPLHIQGYVEYGMDDMGFRRNWRFRYAPYIALFHDDEEASP